MISSGTTTAKAVNEYNGMVQAFAPAISSQVALNVTDASIDAGATLRNETSTARNIIKATPVTGFVIE